MNDLNQHCRDLLGLDDSWMVDSADLDLVGTEVRMELIHRGGTLTCPGCGKTSPRAETAATRT